MDFGTAEVYQDDAKKPSSWVFGLCLPCTKENVHTEDCPHWEALMNTTIEMDPLGFDMLDTFQELKQTAKGLGDRCVAVQGRCR